MHEDLPEIRWCRCVILGCAETSETFISNESLDRVEAADDNIQPQIELETIDEKWFVKIALHCHSRPIWQITQFFEKHDGVASTPIARLCNEDRIWMRSLVF